MDLGRRHRAGALTLASNRSSGTRSAPGLRPLHAFLARESLRPASYSCPHGFCPLSCSLGLMRSRARPQGAGQASHRRGSSYSSSSARLRIGGDAAGSRPIGRWMPIVATDLWSAVAIGECVRRGAASAAPTNQRPRAHWRATGRRLPAAAAAAAAAASEAASEAARRSQRARAAAICGSHDGRARAGRVCGTEM